MGGTCSASPATRQEGRDMVGALLLRGMLVGVVAGILSFGFLKLVGEPPIERAIAFESQLDAAKSHDAHDHGAAATRADPEPELVSRGVQSGIGLFTRVLIYSPAFCGLFALGLAVAYGRACP